MTLKSDVKFGEKLTLGSKNDRKNLVNFNVSSGKSENLQFDVLLLLKVYYVLAKKKCRGVVCHNAEHLKKNWLVLWKMTWGIWHILNQHSNGLLKKSREVMCHYTEDQCKLWSKNDLRFHKWHEEFDEFQRSTQKLYNLHFQILFLSKAYNIELKITDDLCVMTLKDDAIFKEKLTGGLENDMGAVETLNICILKGFFCQ